MGQNYITLKGQSVTKVTQGKLLYLSIGNNLVYINDLYK
jgi:hypothetical protein